LTGLNAGTASLKEADIAGTSAHITSGEDGDRDEYCP